MPDLRVLVKALQDLSSRLKKLETREIANVRFTNNAGVALVSNDIVCVDNTLARSVRKASVGDVGLMIVAVGGVNGDKVSCATKGYGIVHPTCDGAAINIGDYIGASSTTPGDGEALGAPTLETVLGIALEAKGGGAVLAIDVMLV